jgi:hypothetical protein
MADISFQSERLFSIWECEAPAEAIRTGFRPSQLGRSLALPWLVLLFCISSALAADLSPSFEKDVRPIVVEQCISCHNPEKKKGDLDLTPFETTKQVLADEAIWQGVAEKIKSNSMPPKRTEKRPTDDQKKIVLGWITAHIESGEADCGKIATDRNNRFYRGYVMSRRLTRTEYNNTIRDLVGIDLHVDEMLPADGAGGEGFDTNGNALFVSAISLEKYLHAADIVMRAVLPDGGPLNFPIRDAHDRILSALPGANISSHEAAQRIVAAFGVRAFRRPLANSEIDRFLTFFDRAQSRGDSFEASIRLALKAMLISPNFLFLVEPLPSEVGVYELGDYQIATRLSYFLWSSMPDDPLLKLAGEGRLHDESILRAQIERMLRDPRSIALAQNFACQWLGITALGGATRPDSTRFPQFDDDLIAAERQELVLFFDSIIREDRSLLDLIDADYTFANQKLARLYNLPALKGTEMRRVALADHTRGGVLGMAATLTATSYPLRTSPVLRGKWVLEQLLGERIPPPPPTVPQLPQDDHQTDGISFRQRLEQHRSNPECAACHSRMDPIGFGLENFDAIGRWRTSLGTEPVDASGVLTDGQRFSGPQELKRILIQKKSQFLANFSRKIAGYALGRELNKFDQCVLNDAALALQGSDNRPSALIETIVLSKPFLYRYATK